MLGRRNETRLDWNNLLVLVHPEDQGAFRRALFACACGEREGLEQECRILHGRGYFIWLKIRAAVLRGAKGRVEHVVGSLFDQTDFRITQGQLTHAHQKDRLTGLPNRRSLIHSMDEAFGKYRKDPREGFSAIFLDLDRFKFINDSFGHDAGDQFIRKVAKRLQVYQGEADTLARIGGDEFALLLSETRDVAQLRHVADGILVMLSLPILLNGHKIYPTASLGGAVVAKDDEDAEEVLKHAEAAMFQAKGMGKARCEIFEPGIVVDSEHILTVDTELRQALEENQMRL
jgi:diguanylate cyclase (GGDEF)-like protein